MARITAPRHGASLLPACFTAALAIALPACTQTINLGVAGGAGDGAPGGAAGDATDAAAAGGACGAPSHRIAFEQGRAMVLVALQRSTSMLAPLAGETRLGVARAALLGVVGTTRVWVGLISFPHAFVNCSVTHECCASAMVVSPRSGFEVVDALQQAFRCKFPAQKDCFETIDVVPTAAALETGRSFFTNPAFDRFERHVVLITDGNPTCSNSGDPCDSASSAASALLAQDIRTHVVGVSAAADGAECLTRIALAGGAAATPTPVFPVALTQPEMHGLLAALIADAEEAYCTLTLSSAPIAPEALRVVVNGVPVAFDPDGVNGWRLAPGSGNRITLHGAVCREMKNQTVDDIAVFDCPTPGGT